MCGIGGELTTQRLDARELTGRGGRMVEAMGRRGPDGHGVWVDDAQGVVLGHRRLAVIDLGPTGAQPMRSRSRRWTLTYNGEIYNHDQLRAELAGHGVRFNGTNDAETLVEAFDVWGVEATLQRANGMFAFAVWDGLRQQLTLARDRLGEKPLYYSATPEHLGFASELKGLRTLPWFRTDIDPVGVSSVLGWGFVAHPGSIFVGTRQLAPGHLVEARVSRGRVETTEREWWSLADVVRAGAVDRRRHAADPTTTTAHLATAAAQLEPILANAVAERMQADVPLGAFLSGGIDSALICTFAQRALGSTPLRTFTASMPGHAGDETAAAAEVAQRLGTRHLAVEVPAAAALAAVADLPSIWDEPFADPSQLPTLLLCRAASDELSVCLTGDGGDELFGGYNRHALSGSIIQRAQRLPAGVRTRAGQALSAVPQQWIESAARGLQPVLPPRWQVPDVASKVRKAGALMRADQSTWQTLAGVWPLAAAPQPPAAPEGLDAVEQLLWADTALVLPDNMLVKTDRASMAVALELRSPFLDPAVLDWAWRQPSSLKVGGGVGKLVLRELAGNLGLGDVARRPKFGFDPPLAAWLRGPLREWASDLLSSPRVVADGYLGEDDVAHVWRRHQQRQGNHEYQLWALLMLESWFRNSV